MKYKLLNTHLNKLLRSYNFLRFIEWFEHELLMKKPLSIKTNITAVITFIIMPQSHMVQLSINRIQTELMRKTRLYFRSMFSSEVISFALKLIYIIQRLVWFIQFSNQMHSCNDYRTLFTIFFVLFYVKCESWKRDHR